MHVISNIRKLQDARNSHWSSTTAKYLWLFLMGFYDFLTLGKCSSKSRNYSLSTDAYQTDVKTLVVIQLKCKWPHCISYAKKVGWKVLCNCKARRNCGTLLGSTRTIYPSALHCIASRHCCMPIESQWLCLTSARQQFRTIWLTAKRSIRKRREIYSPRESNTLKRH